MNSSMANYLRVIAPYLHPELASPEAMCYLQKFTQALPIFSKAMLEFSLGASQSQVDLSVFFPCYQPNFPENFLSHPAWQTLQSFCQEWLEKTSYLHRSVAYIGLEFDLDGSSPQVPVPSIFVSWNQGTIIDAQALIEIVLKLSNYKISAELKSNLRRCVDCLPNNARIEFLGLMLSRPAQAVRVIVAGLSLKQMSDYLMQIGWSDSTDHLSPLISELSIFEDNIRLLSFDVGNIIYPRIGLEFLPKKQPDNEPQWQLFLHHLVETGLCTQEKQNALLAWPGFSQKADRPNVWPSNLIRGDTLLGIQAFSIFWRKINHIKVVYQPGTPLEAKAYLLFGHDWFNADSFST